MAIRCRTSRNRASTVIVNNRTIPTYRALAIADTAPWRSRLVKAGTLSQSWAGRRLFALAK
jgi:hypothetical protein